MLPSIGEGSRGPFIKILILALHMAETGRTDILSGLDITSDVYDAPVMDVVEEFQVRQELPGTGVFDAATQVQFEAYFGLRLSDLFLLSGSSEEETQFIQPDGSVQYATFGIAPT